MRAAALFKFNNGNEALLCSTCSTIIKTIKDFSKTEFKAFIGQKFYPAQFCAKCKNKINDTTTD